MVVSTPARPFDLVAVKVYMTGAPKPPNLTKQRLDDIMTARLKVCTNHVRSPSYFRKVMDAQAVTEYPRKETIHEL